jgi:hypothetical protein
VAQTALLRWIAAELGVGLAAGLLGSIAGIGSGLVLGIGAGSAEAGR